MFQFQVYNSGFLKGSDKVNRQFLILCFLNNCKANNLSLQICWTSLSCFLKILPFQRFKVIFQWKQMCPCVTMVYHSIPQSIFLQFQRSIFGSVFFIFDEALECWTVSSALLVFLISKILLSKKFATVYFAKSVFSKFHIFQVQSLSPFFEYSGAVWHSVKKNILVSGISFKFLSYLDFWFLFNYFILSKFRSCRLQVTFRKYGSSRPTCWKVFVLCMFHFPIISPDAR